MKITCLYLLSITIGALGPISIATAAAPPVGRAAPSAYPALSVATTRLYPPFQELLSIQLIQLNRAAVPHSLCKKYIFILYSYNL